MAIVGDDSNFLDGNLWLIADVVLSKHILCFEI